MYINLFCSYWSWCLRPGTFRVEEFHLLPRLSSLPILQKKGYLDIGFLIMVVIMMFSYTSKSVILDPRIPQKSYFYRKSKSIIYCFITDQMSRELQCNYIVVWLHFKWWTPSSAEAMKNFILYDRIRRSGYQHSSSCTN